MARYLRIAAAVVFVLLAVALIGLWVRSYYRWDLIIGNDFRLSSYYGITTTIVGLRSRDGDQLSRPVWLASRADKNERVRFWKFGLLGFDFTREESVSRLFIPHWFLAASSLALAALFALKRTWRFSIRTLLITTTLFAGVLGLAVYLT